MTHPSLKLPRVASAAKPTETALTPRDTQDYFTEVAHDYRAWSPAYNLHLGHRRLGLNPPRRAGMLDGAGPPGGGGKGTRRMAGGPVGQGGGEHNWRRGRRG